MSNLITSVDAILATAEREYAYVEVEEWGGTVRIRSLTGKERDKFESGLSTAKGKPNLDNFRARFVAEVLVDEKGDLLFTNSYQVEKLGDKSVTALQKVYDAATSLNGMSDDDIKTLTVDFEKGQTADAAPSFTV